jgi:predicted CXXCH cytochrome family protein
MCHNPHQGGKEKLLTDDLPLICFMCHDESVFKKKKVHSPVEAGMCTYCHSPHASENIAQLLQPVNKVCTSCHTEPGIRNGSHVIRGFTRAGHPVKWKKEVPRKKGKKQPDRKKRKLSCSSCHNPHSSDWGRLFRYKAQSSFDLCRHCHKGK